MCGDAGLLFAVVIVYVIHCFAAVAGNSAAIVSGLSTIARLHALAASEFWDRRVAGAATAARPNVLLEDPGLFLAVVITDIKFPVTPVALDPSLVVLGTPAIACLDLVTLCEPAAAAPRAARIIPRAAAATGLLDVLFEDPGLLLAVVVCVNRTVSNSARILAGREFEGRTLRHAQSTSNVPSSRSRAMRPG